MLICQTSHVHVVNDTQKIQSSDWSKRCFSLWSNAISRLDLTSFRIVWHTGCRYVNSDFTETTTVSHSQTPEYRNITTNPFTTNSKTSSRDFIFINLIVLCYLTRTTANWIRWYKISNMHEILKENRLTNFTTCKKKLELPQSNMQRNNIWM